MRTQNLLLALSGLAGVTLAAPLPTNSTSNITTSVSPVDLLDLTGALNSSAGSFEGLAPNGMRSYLHSHEYLRADSFSIRQSSGREGMLQQKQMHRRAEVDNALGMHRRANLRM